MPKNYKNFVEIRLFLMFRRWFCKIFGHNFKFIAFKVNVNTFYKKSSSFSNASITKKENEPKLINLLICSRCNYNPAPHLVDDSLFY
jgi:hypothetical protein